MIKNVIVGLILLAIFITFITFIPVVMVVMMIIGAAMIIAILLWALGVPLTIRQNGIVTGYVRWFKYYRT